MIGDICATLKPSMAIAVFWSMDYLSGIKGPNSAGYSIGKKCVYFINTWDDHDDPQ